MNTAALARDISLGATSWQAIRIDQRRDVRRALLKKYGSLTTAAEKLVIPYNRLNGALTGRESFTYVIEALQSDLQLSDDKVLHLWPLLRIWPRNGRW